MRATHYFGAAVQQRLFFLKNTLKRLSFLVVLEEKFPFLQKDTITTDQQDTSPKDLGNCYAFPEHQIGEDTCNKGYK